MNKNKWSTSQRLQFAAFAVAATRFMSMGAMALGVDLVSLTFFNVQVFFWLEVISWLGFAALEGYAVPYISRGTRKFEKTTFEYKQLVIYRYIILSAIPLLGAPYYVAMSSGENASIMSVLGSLYWVWAFLFAGVGALIIDAVGTVEEANEADQSNNTEQPKDQRLLVLEAVSTHGLLDPGSLAEITHLPVEIAARELGELHRSFNGGVVKVTKNGKG